MATDSFKIKKSLNIEPIAGAAPTAEGDVAYDLTAHKASLHNGTTASPVVTEAHSATLTNKTFDADGTGNSITNIENADIKAAAAIAVNKLAAVTASKALVSDASGFITASATTSTELGYVAGVTSAIQTQINAITPASSAGELSNLGLASSVSGSALTISLKQADGTTDPSTGSASVKIGMRSATLTSGAYYQRSVTGALSLTVSSGSTLGQTSGAVATLYIYAIDNAGTVELAISQSLFHEDTFVTTTAEGGAGAADSGSVMYSTTARTNVAFRLVGTLVNTQATAGTWASAGTRLSVVGYEIAASETVAARATASGATTIAASSVATKVAYDTVTYDSHSAFSTGSNRYVAPISGTYEVKASIRFDNLSWTQGYRHDMHLYKNNAAQYILKGDLMPYTGTYYPATLAGSGTIKLLAGDYLEIFIVQPEAGTRATLADAGTSWFSITRVGNY